MLVGDRTSSEVHILDGVVERFVAECRTNSNYAEDARCLLDEDAEIVSAAFPLLAEVFGAPRR